MNLAEIKTALSEGRLVFWSTPAYPVVIDTLGRCMIKCTVTNSWQHVTNDNEKIVGKEEDFYILDIPFDKRLTFKIRTIEEAKSFIRMLDATGHMFHLEDDPHEVEWNECEPLTPLQADLMEERVKEIYTFNWGKHTCPIGFYLDEVRPDLEDKPDDDSALIKAILKRKKTGIDCTEEESAEIKGWIKDHLMMFDEVEIESDIQELFPDEYAEAIDEREDL